jgi:hypothetical protein
VAKNLIHGVLGNRINSIMTEKILKHGGQINFKCQLRNRDRTCIPMNLSMFDIFLFYFVLNKKINSSTKKSFSPRRFSLLSRKILPSIDISIVRLKIYLFKTNEKCFHQLLFIYSFLLSLFIQIIFTFLV